MNNNDKSKVIW